MRRGGLIALVLLCASTPAGAAPAVISSVSGSGDPAGTWTQNANGVTGHMGRWDTPYPNGVDGDPAPGLEPVGPSILQIDIDVNDGGLVSFGYRSQSWDTGIWDWFDGVFQSQNTEAILIDHLSAPGADYGAFWDSGTVAISYELSRYRNQHVTFLFSVQQDGWGDQTGADIINFAVRTCPVPPLTPLTDPQALQFEAQNGNAVDTQHLNTQMQAGLGCLQQTIAQAGGTSHVNSGFRPPAYQAHLREVWDRWNDLHNHQETECDALRMEVNQEFQTHMLLPTQQPAATSAHTQGAAFDMTTTLPPGANIDTLAQGCQLQRPVPNTDPIHFTHL